MSKRGEKKVKQDYKKVTGALTFDHSAVVKQMQGYKYDYIVVDDKVHDDSLDALGYAFEYAPNTMGGLSQYISGTAPEPPVSKLTLADLDALLDKMDSPHYIASTSPWLVDLLQQWNVKQSQPTTREISFAELAEKLNDQD